MKDIPSRYIPKDVETGIYAWWEEQGMFHVEPSSQRDKDVFVIVIPPPNITGILHMGHALNNTLQDILVRWKKMQGFVSLWVPGTDHAGIATQNVVERSLAEKGITRHKLARDKFIEEVWKWREKYGNTIISQLKQLGCSCDWARTRFTMDQGLSDAVIEAFTMLYNKGLIYRGNYIINWCPRCQTALSDEEAPHKKVEGKLYHILYPFKEGEELTLHYKGARYGMNDKGIVVATTRPETMLGDVAVAVNPKDDRYKKLIGKKLILPLVNREIEIITDEFVDKKFGTGAVKVTPGHDPDDFEISRRYNLLPIKIMGPDGRMNENAARFKGMDRFECRGKIIKELDDKGLLLKVEDYHHNVGHCYRCHTVIEPYLSLQWFVRMQPLASLAIDAVKSGRIRFYPKRWTKVYLNWMENIKDWCISRQIWWGHRLPVYYCLDCAKQASRFKVQGSRFKEDEEGIIVSKSKPEKCPVCGNSELKQDEDVLDTWFSSWLWPFSTLGWPSKTQDLERFYPTSTLVTAPEILFFWVARMIMAGMEFMGDVPFRHIYIHGTVRDLTGKKMSKSLGNIIDPIEVIKEFGTDALRFSIIAITASGQDVFLSRQKFELGRNFANKIWNASRFVLMNIKQDVFSARFDTKGVKGNRELSMTDKWILSRMQRTIDSVTKSLEEYRFNEAENIIYDFIWHDYCDWYVEMVKPKFLTTNGTVTGEVLIYVLENAVRLLHPFMPFITEAIWQNIQKRQSIMLSEWPASDKSCIDKKTENNIQVIKDIIVNIRNLRADMNIPHSKKIRAILTPLKAGSESIPEECRGYIKNLALVEELTIDSTCKKPDGSASIIMEHFNIFIPLKGVIDIAVEKARLTKKQDGLKTQLVFTQKKLKDKTFADNAPEDIVKLEHEKADKLKEQIKRLEETIKDLQ